MEHFGDALLQGRVEAALACERCERVKLARRLASKLDVLPDAYERRRAALLEGRRVAKEVLALARGGRPLDARRLVRGLEDAERLTYRADDGDFSAYEPAHDASGVRRYPLDARHKLGVVSYILEELARPLRARLQLNLFAQSSLDEKHIEDSKR